MRETLLYQQRLAIAKAYEQFRLLHQLEDEPMTLLAFLQANDLLYIVRAAKFADKQCGNVKTL